MIIPAAPTTAETALAHLIRELTVDDIPALQALRLEALKTAPWAFSASPDDDVARSREFVEQSLRSGASVVFGGFVGAALVGIVGIARDPKQKYRHKAQIWGMYVTAGVRRTGIGAALLQAALERCRTWPGITQVHLCVSAKAEAARRLYERHGFQQWGREPQALLVGDELIDDIHMLKRL